MWQMIDVLAGLERSFISDRTRAGVTDAKRRRVKFGRKPKLTPQQIGHARNLIAAADRREDVAALLNVKSTTRLSAVEKEINGGNPPVASNDERRSSNDRSVAEHRGL